MRKLLVILVIGLIAFMAVASTNIAAADQATYDLSGQITQTDTKFSLSTSDSVKSFRFGKTSIGTFRISGDINEESTYQGKTAYGLESGTLTFSYNYNGSYLKESDTSWCIIDEGAKEVDQLKLDASIKKGVLIIQKSYDGRNWVNAAPPQVNYFGTVTTGNNRFYTADGGDIARGTFYRVIIAYKMHKKTGNYGVFGVLTAYDEIFCTETYSFYACTNTGLISLHSILVDESTISVPRTSYETDGNYKIEQPKRVSKMSYGSAGICEVNITGQFSTSETNGASESVNLARGEITVDLNYSGKMLTGADTSWKIVSSGSTNVDGIKLPSKMEQGVLIIQSSSDGKNYSNIIDPIVNVLSDHPKGFTLPCKVTGKGYYRIIVAYQTQKKTGKTLGIIDNYDNKNNVEVFTFRVSKDSIEGIDIEEDGYSLAILEKGETLANNATTTKGFIVDKLGTTYEVKVNGEIVSDGKRITENGCYDIQITTSLGKNKSTKVYVFRDDEGDGASTYFADVPVSGYRVFRDGDLPTYDSRTELHLLEVPDSAPPLTGIITNVTSGEVVFEGLNRSAKTIALQEGTYHADLYSGYTESGSVYHYELNFNIISEESKPYVNYHSLMTADRLSDLSSRYYQVNYQTTRGGYISVCFADYQHAFSYAYEIEKRFVEDGRYKSIDNPNVKVKYATSGEGLIELTQAINQYAERNVEIAFFDPTDTFTYRTLDDPEQLSNLEALSLPESVKVIPSDEEKALMYLRQPFINGFTFIQAADYDVVAVDAFCSSNNTTYPLVLGKPVDEQLTVSSEYYITETNKYGDTNTYQVFYAADNQTKATWKTMSSGGTSMTETSKENASEITAQVAEIVNASNNVDSCAIVTIEPVGAYSYSLTCMVNDLQGLILTRKGDYTFTFTDRIGNTFTQVVHITGGEIPSSIKQEVVTYSELYNKVYLQDKPVNDR